MVSLLFAFLNLVIVLSTQYELYTGGHFGNIDSSGNVLQPKRVLIDPIPSGCKMGRRGNFDKTLPGINYYIMKRRTVRAPRAEKELDYQFIASRNPTTFPNPNQPNDLGRQLASIFCGSSKISGLSLTSTRLGECLVEELLVKLCLEDEQVNPKINPIMRPVTYLNLHAIFSLPRSGIDLSDAEATRQLIVGETGTGCDRFVAVRRDKRSTTVRHMRAYLNGALGLNGAHDRFVKLIALQNNQDCIPNHPNTGNFPIWTITAIRPLLRDHREFTEVFENTDDQTIHAITKYWYICSDVIEIEYGFDLAKPTTTETTTLVGN